MDGLIPVVERPGWPDLPSGDEVWIGQLGRGDLVCSECVHDPAVRKAVSDINDDAVCGYCGGTNAPFAEDSLVFEYVYRCLCQEYGDPWLESMVWDKEDGKWLGIRQPSDTWDVLAENDSPLGDGSALADSFSSRIEHDWHRLGSEAGLTEERLLWGWDSFEQRLLDGPRFLFSRTYAETGEESVESVFGFIARLAEHIDTDFIKTCATGKVLFRARSDERPLTTASELGSPTPAQAKPQRMSAAGVPCFYAAEHQATAEAEISKATHEFVSVGQWVTTTELTYADFASEFEFPSLFDYPASRTRPYISFLRDFVERIMRPTSDELGEANSYLATQVLTEYLRYSIPLADRRGVDAVRYPSRTHTGGTNWVIFGEPDRAEVPILKFNAVLPATN